jgi:dihydropteroate synthase
MTRTYVTPRGPIRGRATPGQAWSFLGKGAFTALEVTTISGQDVKHTLATPGSYQAGPYQGDVSVFATARPDFAGLSVDKPRLMGVLNVTPDSFSDGGKFNTTDAAIKHAFTLLEHGADVIDVGGESTRPGAAAVDPDEECRRVVPVVKALAEKGAKVSIDTRNAKTMAQAIAAGAVIVNDVTALTGEGALDVIAKSNASVILMHMQGQPGTMQHNPSYIWAPGDVFDVLKTRVEACVAQRISRDRLSVDPGFGFGKNDAHGAALFDHMAMFHGLGCVLTIGVSRKSFIGRVSHNENPDQRLGGSIAGALFAADHGAQIIRVHDVAETRQALAVWAHMSNV